MERDPDTFDLLMEKHDPPRSIFEDTTLPFPVRVLTLNENPSAWP